jgi:hypothetical protein
MVSDPIKILRSRVRANRRGWAAIPVTMWLAGGLGIAIATSTKDASAGLFGGGAVAVGVLFWFLGRKVAVRHDRIITALERGEGAFWIEEQSIANRGVAGLATPQVIVHIWSEVDGAMFFQILDGTAPALIDAIRALAPQSGVGPAPQLAKLWASDRAAYRAALRGKLGLPPG